MATTQRMYDSEEALVLAFMDGLSAGHEATLSPAAGILREFNYSRGKTDVVSISLSGDVVAFEAKLTKWRVALTQAYRNTCFAHRSFVVLPAFVAERAAKHAAEFDRRGVGICAVLLDGRVVIIHDAARTDPVEPWLSVAAVEAVQSADRLSA